MCTAFLASSLGSGVVVYMSEMGREGLPGEEQKEIVERKEHVKWGEVTNIGKHTNSLASRVWNAKL